jgi:DNA-binding MarR family transcriptional regulator
MTETPGYSGISAEGLDPNAVLEVCFCHHIRRAGRAVTRSYDAALAPSGLTTGQFIILTAVAALQPMPAPVLREILAMDRTSLSRTLKPLQEAGFIRVTAGAGRRAGQLSLTPEGASVLRDAAPYWRAAQANTAQRLGTARAGQLLSILTAAATLLREE